MIGAFDSPIHTNDQSIDRVLNVGLPVVLFFQTSSPAPAFEALLERLARDYAGKLLVAQVRPGENPESARRFKISRTPAVVTLRGGQVVSQAEVVQPADVEKHTAYLLGTGPRPAPPVQPQPAAPRPAAAGDTAGNSTHPQVVTDANFEREVLQSAQPVLVDFWAPWCGPCRIVEPTVEKLASEMAGRLRVAKVNVDENPVVAQRFGVQSIPTMLIVQGGKIIDRWAGALPENALRSRVAASLGTR